MRIPAAFRAALLLGLALLLRPVPAFAEATEAQVQALAGKSFNDKIAAVEALAATGDARIVPALEAMLEGNLGERKTDDRVFILRKQGGGYLLIDPLSGAEAGEAGRLDVGKITVNNKLRGVIKGALGGLTLLAPERAVRLAAAQAVFRSRTPEAAPLLDAAIAKESDARVLAAMRAARAAIALENAEEPQARIDAIAALADIATPEVQALLGSLLVKAGEAGYAEPDEGVRAAAAGALADIEQRLQFWRLLGNLFQGVSLGSVLLLAAIGLAITFGVMGVINMAHGEMVMLGAYTTFVVQEAFRGHAPDLFGWSLAVAVPMTFLVAGAFGMALERGIIRFLYGRPLETLLATWGISLILQQAVRTIFGPTNREVSSPDWMSGAIDVAGGLALTWNRLWIVCFALLVLAALMLLLKHTPLGLQMRAVTQNRPMAGAMGIRSGRIDALTFGLGSGIAGMAGVALSQIDNVSPNLGQGYIIDSFMVVVFGGVGNLWGTLVGAMSLGVVNKFLEPYAGAVLGKILILVVIILFIQKRPRGLFALRGRAVEA